MKKLILLIYLFVIQSLANTAAAKNNEVDSLKTLLQITNQDTTRLSVYLILGKEDNFQYALLAEQLADKLLSQTENIKARKEILVKEVEAYNLLVQYYSEGKNADLNKMTVYGEKLIGAFQEMNDTVKMINTYSGITVYYLSAGNFPKALETIQKALETSVKFNYNDGMVLCYGIIGDIYRDQKENTQALRNYEKALMVLQQSKDTSGLINVLAAMGGFYYKIHRLDKSLEYYNKVMALYQRQKLNDRICYVHKWIGDAYQDNQDYANALLSYRKSLRLLEARTDKEEQKDVLDEIGTTYFKQDSILQALSYHQKALQLAKEIKSEYGIGYTSLKLANDYVRLKNLKTAKEFNLLALDIFKRQQYISLLAEAEQLAAEIDSSSGNGMGAMLHYRQYYLLKEKLNAEEIHKAAEREKFQNEFEKQKAINTIEQEKKNTRQVNIRNLIAVGLAATLVLLLVVYRERNKMKVQKQHSENLLLNILPEEVAEELKQKGTADAKLFENVTVFFSDFVSFTTVSEKLSPQQLVNELHECFSAFDHIMYKYGIEKIKTVGDAYLAVSGLPTANPNHAQDMVNAALEIQQFILTREPKAPFGGLGAVRIGIHSGSVVAGIVGVKKFAYDIWGDTVNTAARMEQNGEAGKVNISEATYELVKDKFKTEYRGEIEAKNKGKLKMYFIV